VPFVVREARPEDFEAVTALLEALGRPAVLGGAHVSDHRERFLAWLAAPGRFALVAEAGDRVVGFVDLVLFERLNFQGPQAYVPDFIVAEEERSRGVGRALLAEAERVAREHGAFQLTLESANWRTRAHAFYLREGMAEDARHFSKVLVDIPWPPPAPEAEG
jgi:GNAT superfamily N-acetyltransferase